MGIFYTGYYAKTKKYEEAGLIPVAISDITPSFYEGMCYREFAPRYEMFQRWKNGEINNTDYTQEYKNYLNTLNKEEIREDLDSPYQTGNLIFLCYEKPGDFCHRHVLADWLEENFGYDVKEWEL